MGSRMMVSMTTARCLPCQQGVLQMGSGWSETDGVGGDWGRDGRRLMGLVGTEAGVGMVGD